MSDAGPPWSPRPPDGPGRWSPPSAVPPPPQSWGTPPPQQWGGPPPSPYTTPPPVPAGGLARRVRFLSGLALGLTILLSFVGLASLALAAVLARRAQEVGDATSVDRDAVADLDTALVALTAVLVLLVVGTAVMWVVWQYRLGAEARRLAPVSPAPVWGVVGWIIPVANLGLPQLQLLASARATRRPVPSGALAGWWIAGVAALVILLVSPTLRTPEGETAVLDDIDAFRLGDNVGAAGGVLAAVAALLAVVVVRRLTADLSHGLRQAPTAPAVRGASGPPGHGGPTDGGPPLYPTAPPQPYGPPPSPSYGPPPGPVPPTSAVPPAPPSSPEHWPRG